VLAYQPVALKRDEARLRCCRFVRRGQAAGDALFRPCPKEAVMKTLMAALVLAVGVSVAPVLPAVAQDKAGQKVLIMERIQDLHLTDAQEAKITDIRKEYRPKVEMMRKALAALVKEEMDKVHAVLTPDQTTKLAAIKEERPELRAERLSERIVHMDELDLTDAETGKFAVIRKEYHPKFVKALEGLHGILTDDQRKIREEGLKAGKKRLEILASLKLTDSQKQQLEAVHKELHTLVHDQLEAMRAVLTESQKEKLQEFKDERKEHVRDRKAHRIANLKELNLNEGQVTKINDIRKEYRPKIHEAGNQLRAMVREECELIVGALKK
jgi:Spy/CpxP family protein refolding chaperone